MSAVAPGGGATEGEATAGERRTAVLAVAGTAATIVVGILLHGIAGVTLGDKLPPFIMYWVPMVCWPALAVAVVLAAALATLLPRAIDRTGSPARFAAGAYGAALVLGLAVDACRLGTAGWSHVFVSGRGGSFEAGFEYLPSLPYLDHGVAAYVRRFPALLPDLTTHVKGNPPGPLVVMHLLHLDSPGRLTAACLGVGALCAPAAYGLGRELGDERRGRVAAALTIFVPSVLLFGFTSVDYAFAGVGMLGAWLLVDRRAPAQVLGGLALAVGSFLSWVLLAIPVWAVVCVLLRDGRRAAVRTLVVAAVAILGLTLLLHLAWGYDPLAIVRALRPLYAHGIASHRPYLFWLFGSPAAYLAMLGPAVVWLAARAAARRDPATLALVLVLVISAVAGFTKAETERIWLPFVPLACVAAASTRVARLGPVLASLAGQAIVIQLLFNTVW